MRMIRHTGCIYKELHNHGHNRGGTPTSLQFVRGVGAVHRGYRWVAEMMVWWKRYRCRSYDRSKVEAWLRDMQLKYGDLDLDKEI